MDLSSLTNSNSHTRQIEKFNSYFFTIQQQMERMRETLMIFNLRIKDNNKRINEIEAAVFELKNSKNL